MNLPDKDPQPLDENSFLLCKPHAAPHHAEIIHAVTEAGFKVHARSFNMSLATAEALVQRYPSSSPSQIPTDPSAIDLPTSSVRRGKSDRANGNPLLTATDPVKELLSGTTVALLVTAFNAVEKLLELAGPEDPEDARRAAPHSLRARYGVDRLHNAVYVPSTESEAMECIQSVFGYIPPRATFKREEQVELRDTRHSNSIPGRPAAGVRSTSSQTFAVGPVTFSSLLPHLPSQPELSKQYYTELHLQTAGDNLLQKHEPAHLDGISHHRLLELHRSLSCKQAQLDQRLRDLREREVRLALRERELQILSNTAIPSLRPTTHSTTAASLTPSPENTTGDATKRRGSKWTFQLD